MTSPPTVETARKALSTVVRIHASSFNALMMMDTRQGSGEKGVPAKWSGFIFIWYPVSLRPGAGATAPSSASFAQAGKAPLLQSTTSGRC